MEKKLQWKKADAFGIDFVVLVMLFVSGCQGATSTTNATTITTPATTTTGATAAAGPIYTIEVRRIEIGTGNRSGPKPSPCGSGPRSFNHAALIDSSHQQWVWWNSIEPAKGLFVLVVPQSYISLDKSLHKGLVPESRHCDWNQTTCIVNRSPSQWAFIRTDDWLGV